MVRAYTGIRRRKLNGNDFFHHSGIYKTQLYDTSLKGDDNFTPIGRTREIGIAKQKA
ncbi:hypothetical protein HDE74_001429 [Janthinobacterium sp. K2Li3]|nr:hypothetical protein [Janthinobacterium sp. K2C7]MBB5380743.1 hypothetical protein [Janthinobacterium sp. K2Li3]MBB5385161.1 hypothetical protein [Janthinobacterium sp. K2E3]